MGGGSAEVNKRWSPFDAWGEASEFSCKSFFFFQKWALHIASWLMTLQLQPCFFFFFFSLHVEAKKHTLSHTKLHTQDDRYSTVYDTRRVILHICSCSLSSLPNYCTHTTEWYLSSMQTISPLAQASGDLFYTPAATHARTRTPYV